MYDNVILDLYKYVFVSIVSSEIKRSNSFPIKKDLIRFLLFHFDLLH